MLKALRDKTQGQRNQIIEARPLPAPVKGWYVGAPMADAPVGTAFLLENMFPEYDYVRLRGGAVQYASGMSGVVRTLMPFTDGTAGKLFALNGGNIYDISLGGAVGAPVVTGLNATAIMTFTQYSGTGPQTLVCANGVDPLQFFNGTSWSTAPAWTGLGAAAISNVWQYKNRLYGIAANSTDVYYVGVNAIGGPATVFPMGPLLRLGGKLVAGGTWTQLTSNGELYMWFVISTEGEIVTYTGSFPGDTTVSPWTQSGCYKLSRPLGQNCIQAGGGDIAVLTEQGIQAFSQARQLDEIAISPRAVSVAIGPAFREAVLARAGLTGWQMIVWPLRYMAIVNMPQIGPPHTQFISNARTGAWCRYTGWDARCFAVHGLNQSALYYGTSDGRVMQAEQGGMDDGLSYCGTLFYSYSAIGTLDVGTTGTSGTGVSTGQATSRKRIPMVRPRFQTNIRGIVPKITIRTNFDTTIPSPPQPSGTIPAGALWGVAKWGVDKWPGPSFFETQNWIPTYALASVIAPVVQISIKNATTPDLRLTNLDVMFETGNIFG